MRIFVFTGFVPWCCIVRCFPTSFKVIVILCCLLLFVLKDSGTDYLDGCIPSIITDLFSQDNSTLIKTELY